MEAGALAALPRRLGPALGEAALVGFAEVSGVPGRHLLSTRVLGLGVGVIILMAFGVLALVACAIGSRTSSSGLVAGATGGYFLLCIILIAAPKGESEADELGVSGHDNSIIARAMMAVMMVLAAAAAGIFYLVAHVMKPKYARPIDTYMDVLHRRQ
mmetsp:Transcript_8813/g.28990  ORF Transcript_8813/g.28990 Transcript_8813/m.28990 type:complete len:157 (+) Transcript_8813:103-573(+)